MRKDKERIETTLAKHGKEAYKIWGSKGGSKITENTHKKGFGTKKRVRKPLDT